MEDLIGKTLGQYEIKEKIGQGGMAEVYKAYQPALDRFVAVKVLSPLLADEPGFSSRFQREARAVARLNHPNILQVHDSGVQGKYHYLVMRYIPGSTTLGHLMRQDTSVEQLIAYIVQIADALNYAHEQGMIHRDVKPANILIDGKWALLSDFGLVKEGSNTAELTGTGIGMGTPAYMSPEQARGIRVDHRTDIYALGVILYRILTGVIPHDAPTPMGIMLKRTTESVPPLRQLKPDVLPSLEQVTMRALAREPDLRYETAVLFAEALQKAHKDPLYTEEATLPSSSDLEPTLRAGTGAIDQAVPVSKQVPLVRPASPASKKSGRVIGGSLAAIGIIGFLAWAGAAFFRPTLPPTPSLTSELASLVLTTTVSPSTATPVPPTATLSPLHTPQAVAVVQLEVRSGPGDNYDLLGYLPAGGRAEIASRNESADWWQIKTGLSSTGLGWIQAGADLVETIHSDNVPIALAPATFTPSPTFTLTPTPTPPPTATGTPTPTLTVTAAPTTLPTPTATPPVIVVAASPVNTSPTPPPTPTLPAGQFILLKPVSLEEPSYGPTEFEWQWSGSLAEDQGFEVRVWRDGEPPAGIHNAVLDNQNGVLQVLGNNTYRLMVDISEAAGVRKQRGDYNWTVILVQIEPEYKDLGIQAPASRLRFEPPGSGGGGGSGSGGGGLSGGD